MGTTALRQPGGLFAGLTAAAMGRGVVVAWSGLAGPLAASSATALGLPIGMPVLAPTARVLHVPAIRALRPRLVPHIPANVG